MRKSLIIVKLESRSSPGELQKSQSQGLYKISERPGRGAFSYN